MKAAAIYLNPKDLKVWDENPRDNRQAIPEVIKSIKKFGFSAPIIARRADNMIIEGHTRHAAALEIGLTEVPVRFMDLDPTNSKLLALASNRLSEIADWSKGLAEVVNELESLNVGFDGTGFSNNDIDQLLAPFKESDFLSDALTITPVVSEYQSPNNYDNMTTPDVNKPQFNDSPDVNAPWDTSGQISVANPSNTMIEFICPMSVDERTFVSSVIRKAKRLTNFDSTRQALLDIVKFYDINKVEE